jgi:hypothetical protein
MSTSPTHWSGSTDSVPIAILGSLALGAGGRLSKHLLDLLKRPAEEPSMSIPASTAAEVDYPVDVTPEQARKLQSSGIDVKVATDAGASALGALGYGALAGAGAIGGWKLSDYIIDKIRRSSAQRDVDNVRKRLKQVLEDNPMEEDQGLYNTMKTAEALIKKADFLHPVDSMRAYVAPFAALLGAGLVGSGYGAYRRASTESKSKSKLSALRDLLAKERPVTPNIRMVPRVSKSALQDLIARERENKKRELEVSLPSGSPAQQAEATDVLTGV